MAEEARVPITTTEYNAEGYVVKELFYALDGSVSQVGFTKYDIDANKTEVIFQNPKRGLVIMTAMDEKLDASIRTLRD
jgi:hypothetical protein